MFEKLVKKLVRLSLEYVLCLCLYTIIPDENRAEVFKDSLPKHFFFLTLKIQLILWFRQLLTFVILGSYSPGEVLNFMFSFSMWGL